MSSILSGKTILIAEDEADLRTPLMIEFESLGCRVLEASNGKEAFEILCQEEVDAVISDIRMPGGDGIELLKKIKEKNHIFPVVMLITGFSDLSRTDAYHLGAESILSKPFDLDQIVEAVERILTLRSIRWKNEVDPSKIKGKIEHSFNELHAAIQAGQIGVGRGGLFLSMKENFPVRDSLVSFHIRFRSGDLLSFEGAGSVRWIRHKLEEERLPSGIGIEFEYLSDSVREKVLGVLDGMKLKPYIPKQAYPE